MHVYKIIFTDQDLKRQKKKKKQLPYEADFEWYQSNSLFIAYKRISFDNGILYEK